MNNPKPEPKKEIYHIHVKGILDAKWADYFAGFTIKSLELGETWLSGAVADQAELHGILGKIRDLGLPLLLVKRNDYPQ